MSPSTEEERGGNWEVKWAFWGSSEQEASLQCVCQKGTGTWFSSTRLGQPPPRGPLQLSIWSAQAASTGEDASGRIKVAMQNRSKLFKQQTPSRGVGQCSHRASAGPADPEWQRSRSLSGTAAVLSVRLLTSRWKYHFPSFQKGWVARTCLWLRGPLPLRHPAMAGHLWCPWTSESSSILFLPLSNPL